MSGDAKEAGLALQRLLGPVLATGWKYNHLPFLLRSKRPLPSGASWRASSSVGRTGFPAVSLQAGVGRGSSVKAKSSYKASPALPACVGAKMKLGKQPLLGLVSACQNSSVGSEFALGTHQLNPLLVLLKLLSQLC